jgi:hypothetical protein
VNVLLSWRQCIVLKAAANVDYLPFRAREQINFPYGVWRALVIRGYLRKVAVPDGWEITELGREVLKDVRLRRVKGHDNGGRAEGPDEAGAGERRCGT